MELASVNPIPTTQILAACLMCHMLSEGLPEDGLPDFSETHQAYSGQSRLVDCLARALPHDSGPGSGRRLRSLLEGYAK